MQRRRKIHYRCSPSFCKLYLKILSPLLKPFSKFSDHEVENEQCHSYLCCNYHVCVDSNVAVQSHDVKFVIHKTSCKLHRKVLPKLLPISSLIFISSKQCITTLLLMKPSTSRFGELEVEHADGVQIDVRVVKKKLNKHGPCQSIYPFVLHQFIHHCSG